MSYPGYPPNPAYPPSGIYTPGQGTDYSPYPQGQPGMPSPYPPSNAYPQPGGSPYPPSGGSPYPPSSGSPYPPSGGGSPYPPSGGSPYPPSGGGSYPPSGGGSYPPAGGNPYTPTDSSYGQYPGAAPGYPGAAPGYPGAAPSYPGAAPGYPGAAPSYPGAAPGYPGAAPGYPGASPSYPGAPPGGAPSYPGAPGGAPSYPGAPPGGAPSYPGAPPGGAPSYPGAAPTAYSATQAPMMSSSVRHTSSAAPSSGYGRPVIQQDIPTVRAMPHFDPSSDAAILRKAMKGFGTDEGAIIGILAHRTSDQRQLILQKYQQSFGKDLVKDLKSELSGKFEDTVVALMTPLNIYLAMELHEAMTGLGTDERALVEILCSRDNASIMAIKNSYYQLYRKKIEDDLRGDTSGAFKHLLISMAAASRDESNADPALANSLAQQLYKAGEGKVGTDESEFNRILASYSYPMLRIVFEEYKKIKGKDFGQAIDAELSGDLRTGMKAVYLCIQNSAGYFAKALRDSMAGMGTKDRTLVRLVVSRCEIDMGNIKQEYLKLYGKPLENDIKNDISGDFKKVMIAMVEG